MRDFEAHSLSIVFALANADAGWEKHPDRGRASLSFCAGTRAHLLVTLVDLDRILRRIEARDDSPALQGFKERDTCE